MKTSHISIDSRKVEYTELVALLKVVQLNCSQINEIFGCDLKTDKSPLKEDFLDKEFLRKDGDSKATTYYTLKDSKIKNGSKKYEVIADRYKKGQQLLNFVRTMNERSKSRIILLDPYLLSANCFDTTFVDMNNLSRIESGVQVYFLSGENEEIPVKSSREHKIFLVENISIARRAKFLKKRISQVFPFIFYCDIKEFQTKIYAFYSEESAIAEEEFTKMDVIDIIHFTRNHHLSSANFEPSDEQQLKMNDAKFQKLIKLVNVQKKSSKQTSNARSEKVKKTFELIEKKEVF
ncbi:hypothetical protein [Enterococcus sp. AZ192]|uniref:hypothetical protein n=1 Tax=unclassified Enterococcus TaxID=2608891 RepID=UPI003D2DAF4E